MKIYPWLGIAVIAVSFGAHVGVQAQGIHKCVAKDGKTSYSNSPCPGSKEIEAPAARPPAAKGADAKKDAVAGSSIPEMQAGKWKLSFTRDGRTKDDEMCGDPISGFRQEIAAYAANTKWGCTMITNPVGPRRVNVVYDCPSDRAPDGSPVSKGRTVLSLVSASPQALRLEMKSTVHGAYVMDGTRIGECKP